VIIIIHNKQRQHEMPLGNIRIRLKTREEFLFLEQFRSRLNRIKAISMTRMVSFQVLVLCLLLAGATSLANTEFSFRILFHLQNLNTKGRFSQQAWSALREAISVTLQIPVSQIGLGRVEEEEEVERDVFVSVPVSLETKDYSLLGNDPMKIHSELYFQLDRSIQSKEFIETLESAAIRYSAATEFANVHIRHASFEELIISKNSTSEL
jgi:hypothetical protein